MSSELNGHSIVVRVMLTGFRPFAASAKRNDKFNRLVYSSWKPTVINTLERRIEKDLPVWLHAELQVQVRELAIRRQQLTVDNY